MAGDTPVGQTLDGQYRLDRLLGAGGVGAVYAGWHMHLERPVAVKVLHTQFQHMRDSLARFHREAQMLGTPPRKSGRGDNPGARSHGGDSSPGARRRPR